MTDTERKRIKAICDVANVADIGDLSDGLHTFNSLYYQRMILFAALVRTYKDRAWKSYRHENGEMCFGGGWFIVGIDTPEGSYTYHYENVYFDWFDCVELQNGKHWDGHTEDDVTRLLSLPAISPDEVRCVVHCKDCKWCHAGYCEKYDDLIPRGCANEPWEDWFCADGAKMEVTSNALP